MMLIVYATMDTVEKLLYELKTISEIQKNTKISTYKEFIVIESNSMFQWAYRWRYGDSRNATTTHIANIIDTVITVVTLMLENPKKHGDTLRTFLERLRAGHIGMTNLCDTYKEDQDFIGNIRPVISKMVRIADTIENSFNGVD